LDSKTSLASTNAEPSLSDKASSIALQSTAFLTGAFANYLVDCCLCADLATLRWALLRAGPNETIASWRSRIEWQFSLIADVIGNPFRPVSADQAWLTPDVVTLAGHVYHDRAFKSLPELADALEDAGCHDAAILTHCRGPGPHVRGCWVVDAILGKS
jgi:hypothetical protein